MARTSITDAAALLGVSVDSIRRRLRSGALPGVRDNRGQWWLDLPDNVPPEAATPSVEERLAPAMLALAQQPMQPPDTPLVDALRDQVADLTGRLDRAEARGAADCEAAVAREAELRQAAERQSQELTAALLRMAIAETEARAAREAKEEAQRERDEARRPAWRRWLGWNS
jgi:hypothetical protein